MSTVGERMTEELDRATSHAMERLGTEAGLPPLIWRASADAGGLAMEAHVPADCPDSAQLGARWAAALGMQENCYELHDDVKTWYANLGSWYVEITTASSFWEDWSHARP